MPRCVELNQDSVASPTATPATAVRCHASPTGLLMLFPLVVL